MLYKTNKSYDERRKILRQTVLLKGCISVSNFNFDAVVYGLSLYGAKIKLELPINVGTLLKIRIKDKPYIPARIAWTKDGFLGLEFRRSPEHIKSILGNLGEKLDLA